MPMAMALCRKLTNCNEQASIDFITHVRDQTNSFLRFMDREIRIDLHGRTVQRQFGPLKSDFDLVSLKYVPINHEFMDRTAAYRIDFKFNTPEYTMNEMDENVLRSINCCKPPEIPRLQAEEMENALDRFDKIGVFDLWKRNKKAIVSVKPQYDTKICDICGGADEVTSNRLLQCTICFVKVHQECYGVPYCPINNWTCRRCCMGPSIVTGCVLCPFMGGSLKYDSTNQLIHQICAIYANGVEMATNSFMEPIHTTSLQYKTELCSFCGMLKGMAVKCAEENCDQRMHITCCALGNCTMETTILNGSIVTRKLYCFVHSGISRVKAEKALKHIRTIIVGSANRTTVYPVALRICPLSNQYVTPEFINPILMQYHVDAIYKYWLTRRSRNYGYPMTSRVRLIYDRLSQSTRIIRDPAGDPVLPVNAFPLKDRVFLLSGVNGNLRLVGDFVGQNPVKAIDLFKIFRRSYDPDCPDLKLDFDERSIIDNNNHILLTEVPMMTVIAKLLCTRDPLETSRIMAEYLRNEFEPSLDISRIADYRFSRFKHVSAGQRRTLKRPQKIDVEPWDLLTMIFYGFASIEIQCAAFVNGLKQLDELQLFQYANGREDPQAANLSNIERKCMLMQYHTLTEVCADFHRMMRGIDVSLFGASKREYVQMFEEAACYVMIGRPYGSVIELMLNGEDKRKSACALLKHLLPELTSAAKVPRLVSRHEDLSPIISSVAEYIEKVCLVEHECPTPNIRMVSDLYHRRRLNDRNTPLVPYPPVGLPTSFGHRSYFVADLFKRNRSKMPQISWNNSRRTVEVNEKHIGVRFESDENNPRVISINEQKVYSRTSRPLRTARANRQPLTLLNMENDVQEVRSKQHFLHLSNDDWMRKLPPALSHDSLVAVASKVVGARMAGRVLDPEIISRWAPGEYIRIQRLPKLTKRRCACIRLFGRRNVIEWVPISNINALNLMACKSFVKKNPQLAGSPTFDSMVAALAHYQTSFGL